VRIGTWNLEGRWSPDHLRLLEAAACDLWLLTEVPRRAALPGELIRSGDMPGRGERSWAALWSTEPLEPLGPVHAAAAVAGWRGGVVCSCVLPWRTARVSWPDPGPDVVSMTMPVLERLRPALASASWAIWGGDWNHAATGPERAGSLAGRRAILGVAADVGLAVATADQPHAIPDLHSIDHIAVPRAWSVASCGRIVAEADGARLSDHDAYVVEVDAPVPPAAP
jgi:hypothetical protein